MKEISKLIDLGNRPLLDSSVIDPTIELPIPDRQRTQLLEMLSAKNGFYAFYASLHVFPIGKNAEHMDLILWNEPSLWKEAYEFLKSDIFCFAEDILGHSSVFMMMEWDASSPKQARSNISLEISRDGLVSLLVTRENQGIRGQWNGRNFMARCHQ